MSKKNRKSVYDKLVKEGRLSQDDGSLVKEFGEQKPAAKTPAEKAAETKAKNTAAKKAAEEKAKENT